MFTDGCAVQTPSAPLVHSPLGSVVLSAELVVGFVRTVDLWMDCSALCLHALVDLHSCTDIGC